MSLCDKMLKKCCPSMTRRPTPWRCVIWNSNSYSPGGATVAHN